MSKSYKNDKLVSASVKSIFASTPTAVDAEDYTLADLSKHLVLGYLLTKKRPFGTEEVTFDTISAPYATAIKYINEKGQFMFGIIDVPKADNSAITTIFSSHLDTVESKIGDNIIINAMREGKPVVKALNSVLGADDAAGVYAMIELINRNVAGRYMFFAGEETGGIGSNFAVNNYPELFKGINRAIAIDRKGTGDVVTSQYVGECASEQLGLALAEALSFDNEYQYKPCAGVYTDTANMIELVPECINISSGYYGEHNKQECLDVNYLDRLINQLATLDWDALPTVRDHTIPAMPKYAKSASFANDQWYKDWRNEDYEFSAGFSKKGKHTHESDIDEVIDLMEILGVTIGDLQKYVKETGYVELL
jgi:hypothetical protein